MWLSLGMSPPAGQESFVDQMEVDYVEAMVGVKKRGVSCLSSISGRQSLLVRS